MYLLFAEVEEAIIPSAFRTFKAASKQPTERPNYSQICCQVVSIEVNFDADEPPLS